MWRCRLELFDAILTNVELTMVILLGNISKTAWGSWGTFQQIESLDICLHFFAKIEPWAFYIFQFEMTNFNHKNNIEKNRLPQKFLRRSPVHL